MAWSYFLLTDYPNDCSYQWNAQHSAPQLPCLVATSIMKVFPTHSLSKQAVKQPITPLDTSYSCREWQPCWCDCQFQLNKRVKQKCNLSGKHYMFVKPLYIKAWVFGKPQLPTDNWSNDQRRKGLENANACLIVTFSWSFHKTITFEQLSLIKERKWGHFNNSAHTIQVETQLMLTKPTCCG